MAFTVSADAADALLDVAGLSAYIGVPQQTIYRWRVEKRGPRGIKVSGRHLRYRRSDVEAWLDQQADDRPPAA